jgi:hypothetical protein
MVVTSKEGHKLSSATVKEEGDYGQVKRRGKPGDRKLVNKRSGERHEKLTAY